MGKFRKASEWLAKEPHHLIGIRVLQIAIGATLLFEVATDLPFAGYLWGPHGVTDVSMSDLLGPTLGNIADTAFTTDASTFCVLLGHIAGTLCRFARERDLTPICRS